MVWLDVIGWLGSALLVFSVMQTRLLRFRVLNLVACVVLTGYNAVLGIWPMVAMNLALTAINAWHIVRLTRTRHDERAFTVIPVATGDAYLRHVLDVHAADIRHHQPDLEWSDRVPGDAAYLVLRDDETVGVVLVEDREPGVAHVLLDYVTPRFRAFTPGEFVWRSDGELQRQGYRRVVTPAAMVAPYYRGLGFARDEATGSWVRDL